MDVPQCDIRKSGGSQRRPVDRDVVRVATVPQQNVDFSILRRFKSIKQLNFCGSGRDCPR